ncbi:SCO2322 family protein [Streptomyces orinoci]|uniref:SCO2322 family protein n=1 Tax=Streptomyces orinoci TaxID=67339 RepID=A0ABV3JVB0_STRON|nr:SCO2322 family protein [Streptomyces orinoci]
MTRARTAGALLIAGLLALLGAAPAQAAGYRYWSFWQSGDGKSWTYATQGPAQARPADGQSIGFRFAVSQDSANAAKPRTEPGFAAVCRNTPAQAGHKRVAVVLDFGTAEDAPDNERPPAGRTACAQLPGDASAGDALAAVAKPLRYNSAALLCAISGYPRAGCGEQVEGGKHSGTESGAKSEGGEGPSVGMIAAIAAVVLLGAGALWQARRRRG